MHGLIFNEFKKYAVETYGPEAWTSLAKEADLDGQIFLPDQVYPDHQFTALLDGAAKITEHHEPYDLQVSFGRFIAPHLMRKHEPQINPVWDSLDLIENVETAIHRVVRLRDPNAKPPRLRTSRLAPDEVLIHYNSPRRLCGVAAGIAHGVAHAYDEKLYITEDQCMRKGHDVCDIRVRLVSSRKE